MSWANKMFYLSSSLLLAGTMSVAQSTSGAMPGSSASSQDQDSSMAGQAAGGSLRGCLSGSSDNYTLTDHNGSIYHLVGASSQLQALVGQEVQVSGTPDSRRTGVSDSSAANTASSFQVTDARQVASSCDRSGSSASGVSGNSGVRDHDSQPMSEKPPTTDAQPKGAPGEGAPPQAEPHLMAMLQQPASTDPGSAAAQNSNSSSSMSSSTTSTSQASQGVDSAPQQPIANDANLPAQGHSGAHQTETNTNSTNSGYQNTPAGSSIESSGQQGSSPSAGVGNGNATTPPPVSSQTPAASQSPTNPNSQLGTSPANQTGMSATGANNDANAARQGELSTNPQNGQTTGRGVDNQGVNNPSQTNPNATPTSPNSTSPQAELSSRRTTLTSRSMNALRPMSHGRVTQVLAPRQTTVPQPPLLLNTSSVVSLTGPA